MEQKKEVLEDLHEKLIQHVIEYPGVTQLFYKFMDYVSQEKKMDRYEMYRWLNQEPYRTPTKIQEYVISELQRTQNSLF